MAKSTTEATSEIDFNQYDDVNVQGMLRYLDAVSEMRRLREGVESATSASDSKKQLIERLKKTSEVKGEKVTEEDIELGIAAAENEKSYACKSLGTPLTKMYITRLKWGIPTLIGLASIGAIYGAAVYGVYQHNVKMEKKTEAAVVDVFQRRENLNSKLVTIKANADSVYDKIELEKFAFNAIGLIAKTDDFLSSYCPNGDATKKVTLKNYKQVQNLIVPINQTLDDATVVVSNGLGIVNTAKGLRLSERSIESLIQEIRNINGIPQILEKQAEVAYKSGLAAIKQRQLTSVQQYESGLQTIKADGQTLALLPEQIEQEYKTTLGLIAADENSAKMVLTRINHDANIYLKNMNIQDAKNAIGQFDRLQDDLNLEYDLMVHNRDGEYSYEMRGWIPKGKTITDSLPYLYVEAIDRKSGQPISLRITDQETNETKELSIWGEQVPYNELIRVQEDKAADGKINPENKKLGSKNRGYLSPIINYHSMTKRLGQINIGNRYRE